MNVIILAGESKDDIKYFGKGKALISFNNKPLIQYVIDELHNSTIVDYILVVGNKDALTPVIGNKVDKIVNQENDMLDNLMKGISYFKNDEKLIVITCDIPLITAKAIEHFITEASKTNVDISYPIIERLVCEGKYPEAKRTYASLKDGDFTGGNIIMINPYKIQALEKNIRTLIKYRKNPIKMIRALGPGLVLKMISKQLDTKQLEAYIKERFNIECRAIITPYPEVGSDIDHIEDIKILEKYI